MAYPNGIDAFVEKLNKKEDGVYVIEEEKIIVDGKYEGYLEHDNANIESIQIYSERKLTGEKISNYIISIPSEAKWKRYIKIFTDKENLYVTYETPGDTIEAEDINNLQDSIVATQIELDKHKNDLSCHFEKGVIDGGSFD